MNIQINWASIFVVSVVPYWPLWRNIPCGDRVTLTSRWHRTFGPRIATDIWYCVFVFSPLFAEQQHRALHLNCSWKCHPISAYILFNLGTSLLSVEMFFIPSISLCTLFLFIYSPLGPACGDFSMRFATFSAILEEKFLLTLRCVVSKFITHFYIPMYQINATCWDRDITQRSVAVFLIYLQSLFFSRCL